MLSMVELYNILLRIWGPMPNLFSLLWRKMCCRALFTTVLVGLDHDSLLVMRTPPIFLVVHSHLLCLDQVEGEVVILAPHGQVSDLLPIET